MTPARAFVAVAAAVLVAGCAAKFDNVQAIAVSQVGHADLSCEQFLVELDVATERLVSRSEQQRTNRRRDGLLNALVISGLGAVISDRTSATAQPEGAQEVVQREYVGCDTRG